MEFILDSAHALAVGDAELQRLLTRVYVDGGFTDAQVAASQFAPAAVRARGTLLCARPRLDPALAGMVIVVPPGGAARRLAQAGEAEMHLLAVDPAYRGHGLGKRLVLAALDQMASDGCRQMVLFTQTGMLAAHRLYASCGFERVPALDFTRNGREFLVFQRILPS